MEESPEQILARLVRYRDSLNREAGSPSLDAAQTTVLGRRTAGRDEVAAVAATAWDTDLLPAPVSAGQDAADPSWRRARSAVLATVFGQFLAVLGCAFAVAAFERLGSTIAVAFSVAGAALGLIAVWRRVPFALWWTAGVVIGGVLGRWS